MNDLVAEYVAQKSAEGQSAATVKNNTKTLNKLISFLKDEKGRQRLADVEPQDLDDYMLSRLDAGLKLSCRQGEAWIIRPFFRWLAESGRILSNPARDIAVPEDDDIPLAAPPLEEIEVAEIIDSIPKRGGIDLRNRLHIELLYSCGLRLAESIALNVKDFDLTRQTVHVRQGKGNKERILPLMRCVTNALEEYLCLRRSMLRGPDDGALLLDRVGKRIKDSAFRSWLQSLNKRRGRSKRQVYPHLFRHSIAVHLLRGGADIRHIQEFLGHEKLDTTKRYLRLVPGRLKEDYEKAMPTIAVMA